MAVEKIMFGVGFSQIITSLISIALCTRHYSDTQHMETSIAHVAVLYGVRSLPAISLLVCGIMGVIISCVNNRIARIVHTTSTCQTTLGLAMNIWFFSYQTLYSPVLYDKGSAMKCLIAAVFCFITCLCYISYLLIRLCQKRNQAMAEDLEKARITDMESSLSSPSESSLNKKMFVVRTLATDTTLKV